MVGDQSGNTATRRREPRPTILLVEPLSLVRHCLRSALESNGYWVVGEATTLSEAATTLADLHPVLVLADTDVAALKESTSNDSFDRAFAAAPIIILSSRDDPPYARRVLEAGAADFISLNAEFGVLLTAIEAVLRRHYARRPRTTAPYAEGTPPEAVGVFRLTGREREVAILIAKGLGNKEIASQLQVAPVTVRNHISRIMQRTGTHSRAEVAAAVALAGWI